MPPAPRPPVLAVLAVLASLVAWSTAAAGPSPITGLAIFGDSLSDIGRFFAKNGEPGPPYFEGRFSNGPVWAEGVGPMLGLDEDDVVNLAVGRAPTGDVLELQVQPYIDDATGPLDADDLHVLFAGANDFRLVIEDPTLDPVEVLEQAVANHAEAIERLADAGAVRFCVFNLPDLGATPLVTQFGDPFLIALATAVSEEYNEQLAAALDAVEASRPIDLVRIDSFAVLGAIGRDPAGFGFVNVVDRAYDELTGEIAQPVDGYLYWDDLHPTRSGHAIVRDHFASVFGALRPADVTRDGRVGFDDVLAVLAGWGPCPVGPCEIDVDGSGTVDVADLGAIVDGWDG